MAKRTIADASAELYKLLEPFESDERARIVRGTLTLLGEQSSSFGLDEKDQQGGVGSSRERAGQIGTSTNARGFFDKKAPANKIEELAAAARFREQHENSTAIKKEDFKRIISDQARRNFDSHNFNRDINNARNSGFFNKGGSAKNGYTLSYYGQNFIDALPDREAAKKLHKPKSGRRTKKGRAGKAT